MIAENSENTSSNRTEGGWPLELKVDNLDSGYGEFIAIRNISLSVGKGEIVSIIGPNGAGKTTLLKTIIGLLKPKKGEIHYQGRKISGRNPRETAKSGIGYVPQGAAIFPQMTVKENIRAGAYVLRNSGVVSERMQSVLTLFPRLTERINYKAYSLSGGERQMLLLGRALMLDPKLILLDEPSTGLDPKMQTVLYGTIKKLNSEGKSILLVEQNVHKALDLSNRCYVLEAGRVVQTGVSKELKKSGRVREAYLGLAEDVGSAST
ncbi:MAG TPA: ABC transporter ATP-binding protein [Nitrososphaerales archaeon]|nr:ABC transporter ATP-binding protein [Nitrososphaerales archaeon]